jgi:hypothetical protein
MSQGHECCITITQGLHPQPFHTMHSLKQSKGRHDRPLGPCAINDHPNNPPWNTSPVPLITLATQLPRYSLRIPDKLCIRNPPWGTSNSQPLGCTFLTPGKSRMAGTQHSSLHTHVHKPRLSLLIGGSHRGVLEVSIWCMLHKPYSAYCMHISLPKPQFFVNYVQRGHLL